MQHNCQFMGMIMINTCLDHAYTETGATYVERVEMPDMSIDTVDAYEMHPLAPGKTQLKFHIDWKETPLPSEQKQGMMQGIKANMESLKRYVENHPA